MTMNAPWLRFTLLTTCALAILLTSASVFAAGRVQWKSKRLKEDDGSWKIEVTIHMSRAPDFAHVPMKFKFQPTMYYERMLTDESGDKVVMRKVPLRHRQPLIESVDVGFLDPAQGSIQKRTRFSFRVTRGHGFEAGEYKVSIKNGRTGASVGTAMRIVFDGENEVIDRRSMVFTGKKKKKKDEEESEEEEQPAPKELTPDDPAFWEGGPTEEEEADGPPPIEEKPGGCGCRVAGESPRASLIALLMAGLVGAAFARRRST